MGSGWWRASARFTHLQLLHQEGRVVGGLLVQLHVDAVELEQVDGALNRVFQGLVGRVDLGGLLQRQALLLLIATGETVRVHHLLQFAVTLGQRGLVDAKAHRHAEQLEIVLGEIDHG
jgi:hypothetical protein